MRRTIHAVSLPNRYATTIGRRSRSVSSVAVPDFTSTRSAAAIAVRDWPWISFTSSPRSASRAASVPVTRLYTRRVGVGRMNNGSSKSSRSNAAVSRNTPPRKSISDARLPGRSAITNRSPATSRILRARCLPFSVPSSSPMSSARGWPTKTARPPRSSYNAGSKGKQRENHVRRLRDALDPALAPEIHGWADVVGRGDAVFADPALHHQVEDVEVDPHHGVHALAHEMPGQSAQEANQARQTQQRVLEAVDREIV